MDQINALKSLPTQKDSPKPQEPTTVVPDNRSYPILEGGQSANVFDMWTMKHEIGSPKLY